MNLCDAAERIPTADVWTDEMHARMHRATCPLGHQDPALSLLDVYHVRVYKCTGGAKGGLKMRWTTWDSRTHDCMHATFTTYHSINFSTPLMRTQYQC